MRDLTELDEFRALDWEQRFWGDADFPRAQAGAFRIPSPVDGRPLRCIVSAGLGPAWDHVSASRGDRCPWWEEMDFLARKFFRDGETAMQLHVPLVEHINFHPYTLHLWRPRGLAKIPKPPADMVGPATIASPRGRHG